MNLIWLPSTDAAVRKTTVTKKSKLQVPILAAVANGSYLFKLNVSVLVLEGNIIRTSSDLERKKEILSKKKLFYIKEEYPK